MLVLFFGIFSGFESSACLSYLPGESIDRYTPPIGMKSSVQSLVATSGAILVAGIEYPDENSRSKYTHYIIRRSSDQGRTWKNAFDTIDKVDTVQNVGMLLNDPKNNNIYYAFSNIKGVNLFKSSDKGLTWTKMGVVKNSQGSLYFLRLGQNQKLYLGIYGGSTFDVLSSFDQGLSWKSEALPNVGSLGNHEFSDLTINDDGSGFLFMNKDFEENTIYYRKGESKPWEVMTTFSAPEYYKTGRTFAVTSNDSNRLVYSITNNPPYTLVHKGSFHAPKDWKDLFTILPNTNLNSSGFGYGGGLVTKKRGDLVIAGYMEYLSKNYYMVAIFDQTTGSWQPLDRFMGAQFLSAFGVSEDSNDNIISAGNLYDEDYNPSWVVRMSKCEYY